MKFLERQELELEIQKLNRIVEETRDKESIKELRLLRRKRHEHEMQ